MLKLSPYHKTFYYEWKLDPSRHDYHLIDDKTYQGKLSPDRLNSALIRFMNDHYLFNCNIIEYESDLFWRNVGIIPEDHTLLEFYDSPLSDNEISKLISRPFDLENDHLTRHLLIKCNDETYRLINVVHHILIDGLSYKTFNEKIGCYYNDYKYKFGVTLQEQKLQYNNILNKFQDIFIQKKKDINSFWSEHLKELDVIDLHFLKNSCSDFDSTETRTNNFVSEIKFGIEESIFHLLDKKLADHKITPFIFGQIVFGILINKITGSNNFGLNYVVSIQEGKDIIFGGHVNSLILDMRFNKDQTLFELILETSKYYKSLRSSKAKYLPTYELIKYATNKEILNVAFIQTDLRTDFVNFENSETAIINSGTEIDLDTPIAFEQEYIKGKIEYRVRYDEKIIDTLLLKQFIELFKKLLINVANDINNHNDRKIDDYILLNTEEQFQLIDKFSYSESMFTVDKTIVDIFNEQSNNNPENIAVVTDHYEYSYKEINENTNRFAHYLLEQFEIKPDNLILLCLEKSEYMVISILSSLKVGAAYVPMSPEFPISRLEYIIKDSKSKILITDNNTLDKLRPLNKLIKTINIEDIGNWNEKSSLPLPVKITPTNLAYIIYTSGTTGKPKGVQIEHKGVVSLINHLSNLYRFKDKQNILFFSNYIFDASMEQLYLSLLSGHKLVILKDGTWKDEELFISKLNNHKVTYIDVTPSLLQELNISSLKYLKLIVLGGEAVTPYVIDKIKNNNIEYANSYGPTETTITATVCKNNKYNIIGTPVANTTVYVLNDKLEILPIGAIGELHVGGIGVARGYLNLPELTEEKFIVNPFQKEEEKSNSFNDKLYKTGDLVRMLPDGNIEFIGRNDFQVKIRGYRIELEEIENALCNLNEINQAKVFAKETKNGTKYLAAYYTSEAEYSPELIKANLKEVIPEYMIPSAYIHLVTFPLTLNGKLDHKSLPDPHFKSDDEYIQPKDDLEKSLCKIYTTTLGLDSSDFSVETDFFKAGGDSISSIQLSNKIRQILGYQITVKDIFQYRTIRSLGHYIKSKNKVIETLNEQGKLIGNFPLLPIQKWFFDNVDKGYFPQYNYYNQSFFIKVPELDTYILNQSIFKLVEYHDILSTEYNYQDSSYFGKYVNIAFNELQIIDIQGKSTDKISSILSNIQSNFNIHKGYIYQFGYIKGFSDRTARIFAAFHHLVIDAVSWKIIINDLKDIYNYLKDTQDYKSSVETYLGNKNTSYRQWSNLLNEYAFKNLDEKKYWDNILDQVDIFNNIIKTKIQDEILSFDFHLDKAFNNAFLNKVSSIYNTTLNDVLLAALCFVIPKFTNHDTALITLEGHGREYISDNANINNTVGWFTSMYPISIPNKTTEIETLICVKDYLRKVPNNGIGYGSIYGFENNKLPNILFNFLGKLDEGNRDNWSLTNEYKNVVIHPSNKQENALEINVYLLNEKLHFSIQSRYDYKESISFCNKLKKATTNLLHNLHGRNRTFLTTSDVNFIVDQNLLNKIQKDNVIDSVYLANSLQQGFIYHSLIQDTQDNSYNTQLIWNYHKEINEILFKKAWEYALQKFPALRLSFNWGYKLLQIINHKGHLNWLYIDISVLKGNEQKKFIEEKLEKDRSKKYDLSKNGLLRVYLIYKGKNNYSCILGCHHAIMDGWSTPVLIDYVHSIYIRLTNKEKIEINEDISYLLSQEYTQKQTGNHHEFWKARIKSTEFEDKSDLSPLLNNEMINTDISQYKSIKVPKTIKTNIDNPLIKEIKRFTNSHSITNNSIFQYCWHKMISIYGNSDLTIVGTTVSGRNLPIDDIDQSVGLYINTLPVIVNHGNRYVADVLIDLQNQINEINQYSNINLSSLQKNGRRIFNSLFVYENYPRNESQNSKDKLGFEFVDSFEQVDYPLSVTIIEENDTITFSLTYASELFEEEMINLIVNGFLELLKQIISNDELCENNFLYNSKKNNPPDDNPQASDNLKKWANYKI